MKGTNKTKKPHQAAIYQSLLAVELQDPKERFRFKMERWNLQDPIKHAYVPGNARQNNPRWRAERAHWMLSKLSPLVPPRVSAAVFSTIWNRWTTTRRYQQRVISCRLGCGLEEGDSIEHYCRCPIVQECCRRALNLDPRHHASLHGFTLATPHINNRCTLTTQGLLIYAVYTTFNRIHHSRKGNVAQNVAYDAIVQATREGARGHAGATKTLRERYLCTEDNPSPLPPPALIPYTARQKRIRELQAVHERTVRKR